jgi:hypothetical protein
MNRDPFRRRAARAFALSATLAAAATGSARAGEPAPTRFVGTYTVIQVGGAGVQRMELRLGNDGRASMRTVFSRLTQRPVESGAVPPVLEHGTWHERKGRAIVHITQTSSDDANAAQDQKPQYADLTFVLSGCELRLVTEQGPSIEFSKKHCIDAN